MTTKENEKYQCSLPTVNDNDEVRLFFIPTTFPADVFMLFVT